MENMKEHLRNNKVNIWTIWIPEREKMDLEKRYLNHKKELPKMKDKKDSKGLTEHQIEKLWKNQNFDILREI